MWQHDEVARDGKSTPGSLGERMRRRRVALGITAKAMARLSGVSVSYISQLERGRQRDPSLPLLRRFADVLAIDLAALLGAEAVDVVVPPIPAALEAMAVAYCVPEETARMLARINIDGCQPATLDDWLFLWLALRQACRRANSSLISTYSPP